MYVLPPFVPGVALPLEALSNKAATAGLRMKTSIIHGKNFTGYFYIHHQALPLRPKIQTFYTFNTFYGQYRSSKIQHALL